MKNLTKLVLMAILAVSVLAGVANAQTIKTRFDGILIDHDADINGNATIGGTLDVTGAVTMDSTLQVGDNYPLTSAASGYEFVCGSQTITGTAAIDLSGNLTAVSYATAMLAEDPGAGAGDAFIVSIDNPVTTSTLTINVWQDDATAGTAGALVHYCALGTE